MIFLTGVFPFGDGLLSGEGRGDNISFRHEYFPCGDGIGHGPCYLYMMNGNDGIGGEDTFRDGNGYGDTGMLKLYNEDGFPSLWSRVC